jgi:hypothetical protein
VLSIWQDAFRVIREWGCVYVIVMRQQVTGRPMQLAIVRNFSPSLGSSMMSVMRPDARLPKSLR